MTARCHVCGGWGYVGEPDPYHPDPRIVPCWRGCIAEDDRPDIHEHDARMLAEVHAREEYISVSRSGRFEFLEAAE